MELWSLVLSLVGLVLGLISAWPKLSEWFARVRTANSQRSEKSKQKSLTHITLATSDVFYFIAYVSRNGFIGFGFLWLALSLDTVSTKIVPLQAALIVVRLAASFIGGSLLGGAAGASIVIMRRKQRAAESGG